VWSALLLGPPLWFGMVSYGHAELPLELWLVLLAVRQLDRGRIAVAGCLLGLALLTQTAVLLAALPLVLLLLSDRRFRATIVLLGTASMTAAAGLLPFLLADGRDLIASLVTYRGQVPALGGSLLTLLPRGPLAAFMQHHDALVFGGAAVVLTWVALRGGRATRPGSPRVYGLMALSSACLPLLAKSAWPYYLADPCVFATIWWLARPGSVDNLRLCVPALFAGASATLLVGAPGICVALAVACGMVLLLADLRGVKFPAITTEPGCAERQGADPAAGARAIST
ncbi:MAG: hypothetical protein ABR977_13625, partial [Candidatus Dormibacteria bacterium]